MIDAMLERIGWTLVHSLWQGAAAALALGVVLGMVRSARVRYAAAVNALAGMVVAAGVTFAVLAPRATESGAATAAEVSPVSVLRATMTVEAAGLEMTHGARSRVIMGGLLPWAAAGWMVGVVVLSARLAGSAARVRRMVLSAAPADGAMAARVAELARRLGVVRRVAVVMSEKIVVPATVGVLRPVILVPVAAMTQLSPGQIEAILAHELAHIRRWDYAVNLLQCVGEALLFHHPAAWWISARIRAERECCCDEMAAGVMGNRAVVAEALVAMESARVPALAMGAAGGSLGMRVRRLVTPPPRRGVLAPMVLVAMVVVAGMYAASCSGPGEKKAEVETVMVPSQPTDESPADRAVRARLSERITMKVRGQEFEQAVNRVRDAGVVISVNWTALEGAGVDRKTAVSLDVDGVPMREALSALLASTPSSSPLGWEVDEGVVTISTRDDIIKRSVVVRVYDVRDLLVVPGKTPEETAARQAELMKEVRTVVMTAVAADTWLEQGGTIGAIRELEGHLIVTQSKDAHRQVRALLGQLREARSIQVLTETRLILLPVPIEEFAKMLPAATREKVVAALRTGAAIDEKDATELQKALQSDRRTVVVSAPRITAFSGEAASVSLENTTQYVRTYEDKGKGLAPVMGTVATGVTVGVTATASADRRSVVLSISPTLRSLERMDDSVFEGTKLKVQSPRVQETALKLTASVPDKATLVAGGQRVKADREEAMKGRVVPGDGYLLVLVRPTIILPRGDGK